MSADKNLAWLIFLEFMKSSERLIDSRGTKIFRVHMTHTLFECQVKIVKAQTLFYGPDFVFFLNLHILVCTSANLLLQIGNPIHIFT